MNSFSNKRFLIPFIIGSLGFLTILLSEFIVFDQGKKIVQVTWLASLFIVISTIIIRFYSIDGSRVNQIIEETNHKLWKSLLERVTKYGVQWYMMGDYMSRLMVDIGAYSEEFYNLMKSIKQVLDPKMILSRGKFNFWGER